MKKKKTARSSKFGTRPGNVGWRLREAPQKSGREEIFFPIFSAEIM